MSVLGVDLAAQAARTCACVLEEVGGELRAELHLGCDDDRLMELADGQDKVAVDAPFGWPGAFVDALVAHRAGDSWPAPEDADPQVFRASLSFRATDRVVMHTRRPLSVSTDRLGVTAMRCAGLLDRWSRHESVDRTGEGRFVEVYPAGALVRWELAGAGYKGADAGPLAALLAQLRRQVPALQLHEADEVACASNHDAFDALVASLVARAALLGFTDGPSPPARAAAAQEGWIHLPVRGSLPFLHRRRNGLGGRPEPALARRLREQGVAVDEQGYAARVEEVLLAGIGPESRKAVERDLRGKGGSELVRRADGRIRFCAAHSSAALAANTFGPFLPGPAALSLGGEQFSGDAALEVECPTGLRGTPPTLDFVLDGEEVLAVESKCVETFSRHEARFADDYAEAMDHVHASWRQEHQRLVEDPRRYRCLDAAQLVKHYLGLRLHYPGRPVTLVYLYWRPTNADELAPCAIHAAELRELERRVRDPRVAFLALAHDDLWAAWSAPEQPMWLREHAAALRQRYELAV